MNDEWVFFLFFFYHVNCRKVLLSLLQLMGFHDWHGNGWPFQRLKDWFHRGQVESQRMALLRLKLKNHAIQKITEVRLEQKCKFPILKLWFSTQCFEETILDLCFCLGHPPNTNWIWAMPICTAGRGHCHPSPVVLLWQRGVLQAADANIWWSWLFIDDDYIYIYIHDMYIFDIHTYVHIDLICFLITILFMHIYIYMEIWCFCMI